MKLFPKLALTVSFLLLGATLALTASFYIAERSFIRAQADQERRGLLQNLAHIAQEAFLTNDDLLLVKYVRWLQKWNPSLASASVVDTHGEVLAHSEPDQIGKSSGPLVADPNREAVLVLTQPVHLGNQWVATASLSFSELQYEQTVAYRLQGLKKRLGPIVAGAMATGLVISFVFAVSWTRPIGQLAEAARRIGQGQYAWDLSGVSGRRDELGFLSKTFQGMARDLQELDRMKEDFVSAVTHELRSPLGAIESYLNLIQEEIREGIPPAAWLTYADRLRVNTRRLTRFVNDLLDVAALDRGKIALEPGPVNLSSLIQDVVAFYAAQMAEHRLTCVTRIPDGDPAEVWADAEKVRQVLVNLLSNAIKFTPEQGRIEVGVGEGESARTLIVYVRDSGPGIAPEHQMKIFNKFEQVPSARGSIKGPKGTGLGLSIARALVELHGDCLRLESKPGEGCCFYFALQRKEVLV